MSAFLYESDGPIRTITFNRPERRNGVDPEILAELEGLIHRVRDDNDARALIVTGTGTSWCAGADFSYADRPEGEAEKAEAARLMAGLPRINGRVFDAIASLEVMTVAAINGYCIGGGWAYALAFDHIVSVPDAEFWVPEVDLGQAFRGFPAMALAARLGPTLAKEAMILCRHFTGAELEQLRVINETVSPDELQTRAREIADAYASKPAKAAVGTKRDINAFYYGPKHY